ncbi:MAG TPA: cell division protein ZapA [Bacilli bacterium]
MNDAEKTRVTVDIYGMQYRLMGNSSTEYMQKVAGHVNEQMNKIAKGHPRLDLPRIAVLAAVNVADEYFRMKEQWEERLNDQEVREWQQKYSKLEQAHNALLRERETAAAKPPGDCEECARLREELAKLQEEYEKLQNEYNEWIQLTENE